MRTLAFGVLAGLLLSLLRAPAGLDLVQLPAVEAHTAFGVRALALFVIAGGLLAGVRSAVTPALLAGATLGYAAHGLLLANLWSPGSRVALVATALAGLALLVACARGLHSRGGEDELAPPAPNFGEMLGLALAGAGLAVGLEILARHLRLHGTQLAADDAVFGSVLLALLFVGALAFGWIARLPRWRTYAPGLVLAGAGAALFIGLRSLRAVTEYTGLREYVHTFGLDLSLHGTPAYDALLAASFFVAPAFLIGAALDATSGRKRLFALLVGAAAGLCFLPSIFESPSGTDALVKHTFAAQYLTLASLAAVGGATFALLCLPGKSSPARWLALLACAACAVPAALIEVKPQSVLAPWARTPVMPYTTFDIPEGLVTVEGPLQPPGASPLLNKQVTLGRRTLVPGPELTRFDLVRLDLALGQLPDAKRARKDLRALIVGQLTPLDAHRLLQSGFASIDRSAAWHEAMERIERELFAAGEPLPPGDRLAPGEARERLAAGRYDLVYVPATGGDAPRLARIDVPADTLLVVWLDASSPLASRTLGPRVMLAALGLEYPSLALVVHGRPESETEPLGPQFLAAGERVRAATPLASLARRETERIVEASRAELFARLAAASAGSEDEALARGLAAVYAGQTYSSPFDKPAERFELPAEALALLRQAALARKPNAFAQMWEWLAEVLAEKRWIPQMYEQLEPLAKAWAPWPKLEQMLARADAESARLHQRQAPPRRAARRPARARSEPVVPDRRRRAAARPRARGRARLAQGPRARARRPRHAAQAGDGARARGRSRGQGPDREAAQGESEGRRARALPRRGPVSRGEEGLRARSDARALSVRAARSRPRSPRRRARARAAAIRARRRAGSRSTRAARIRRARARRRRRARPRSRSR